MRSRVPRKFRILSVWMVVLAASLAGRPASADMISLGTLSFDPYEIDQSNAFWISNLTGDPANGGAALPPEFPVMTPLTFLDAWLRLVDDQGAISNVYLDDVGQGLLMDPFGGPWPELIFDASTAFVSATLTATLSAPSLLLADGATFVPTSLDIIAELSGTPGLDFQPGAFTTIDIVGDRIPTPAPVPEPGTFSLLLLGGLFGAARVRAAARSSRWRH
jgi:hypothetical protein